VGLLEEALFRGAIFGLFRRSLPPLMALFCVTFIFAAVHFLKPLDSFSVPQVTWLSGFTLLPHLFHQFGEPMTLLAGFTTIFTLGWVVGAATLRTRSLWLGIGFHAGLVFVKMSFSKFTKRDAEYLPWVGEKLEIGLVPVAALALCGVLVWLWLKYVDRPDIPSRA
jgi:membrane protease YdiL (CAAX protease family)